MEKDPDPEKLTVSRTDVIVAVPRRKLRILSSQIDVGKRVRHKSMF